MGNHCCAHPYHTDSESENFIRDVLKEFKLSQTSCTEFMDKIEALTKGSAITPDKYSTFCKFQIVDINSQYKQIQQSLLPVYKETDIFEYYIVMFSLSLLKNDSAKVNLMPVLIKKYLQKLNATTILELMHYYFFKNLVDLNDNVLRFILTHKNSSSPIQYKIGNYTIDSDFEEQLKIHNSDIFNQENFKLFFLEFKEELIGHITRNSKLEGSLMTSELDENLVKDFFTKSMNLLDCLSLRKIAIDKYEKRVQVSRH